MANRETFWKALGVALDRLGGLVRAGRRLAVGPRRREGVQQEAHAEDDGADDRHQAPARGEEEIGAGLIRLVGQDRDREAQHDQRGLEGVLEGGARSKFRVTACVWSVVVMEGAFMLVAP